MDSRKECKEVKHFDRNCTTSGTVSITVWYGFEHLICLYSLKAHAFIRYACFITVISANS
jgi:hypothetical protein